MAHSGILASTVGLLALISLTNGQTDVNKPLPACGINDMVAHPVYPQMFIHCSNNLQVLKVCSGGNLYDTRINNCNHVEQAINFNAPCSPGTNTVGRNYPGVCCENYYRCNGENLVAMTCPTSQVFNAQSGQCGQGPCVDHNQTCSRPKPPSGIQWMCPMIPDPINPCNFRYSNVSGSVGPSQSCAEGTRFDIGSCGCIADKNYPCLRPVDASGSRTPDPNCGASFLLDFKSFKPGTNNPQAVSEKTGAPLPDYIQVVNALYGSEGARLNSNTQTGAYASLHVISFSNREVSSPIVVEVVFRAVLAGTFEVFSNNHDGACVATISINATYNGNGQYQVSGFITGSTPTTLNQQVTNTAQLSASINVGTNEFILVRVTFDRTASLQLGNRGTSGTATGQTVNGQASGVIGEKLAFNNCGFQFCRGLSGDLKSVIIREYCLNPGVHRT